MNNDNKIGKNKQKNRKNNIKSKTNFKTSQKNNNKSEFNKTIDFCNSKIKSFKNMITSTILSVQRYKTMDIISANDMNTCINNLEVLYKQIDILEQNINHKGKIKTQIATDEILNYLQKINTELSVIFKTSGTQNIVDLILVAMGSEFLSTLEKGPDTYIFETIKKYVHPIGYIVIPWKKGEEQSKTGKKIVTKNRIIEDYAIVENGQNFDCFDLARTSRDFQKKIYGIKTALHDPKNKKTVIISGIVDELVLDCISDKFIQDKIKRLINNKPKDINFSGSEFETFISTLTIKELLIYETEELYKRFTGYITQTNLIKQKPISQNVKEFIGSTLFEQRKTLIQLLLKKNNPEYQYLAYLLYDLLSNDTTSSIDTVEQTVLFDSLPWNIKKLFREAMKTTINYTKILSSYDSYKIPLEQQICLMKVNDAIKEKAMIKLKEVKAKAEDSGSKARQYLEGLLKIPFGLYKKEPILYYIDDIIEIFKNMIEAIKKYDSSLIDKNLKNTDNITTIELVKYYNSIKKNTVETIESKNIEKLKKLLTNGKRDNLVGNILYINNITKSLKKYSKICHSGKKSSYMINSIIEYVEENKTNDVIIKKLMEKYSKYFYIKLVPNIKKSITDIDSKWNIVKDTIDTIGNNLDEAVYGHEHAKRQLKRVIGQWISGENNGYCLGFEGPPGVGKTSIAKKGLVDCLKDKNGVGRPFAMIQIGGGSNASTISGHGFTYVGSQWGRIVDILIETKCMNPIIFIDEVDKISQSENGKEITGILTHLVDPTQNDQYQDKYFSGIDIDLSKALFIFSYNDATKIDSILLDRFHRIKFEHLSLDDKLVISKKYILPELYKKFEINDCVNFTDDILEFIINTYTYESGVRKLKEILYEIIGEINLEILELTNTDNFPITLTQDMIVNKYLKNKIEVTFTKIHKKPQCGLISGLWANSLGKGGIIQIECAYIPSNSMLDLKLTGSLGDVMKESSEVAKDVAWSLTDVDTQNKILTDCSCIKKNIRIHFPEGATPKNGPSAGTAVAIVIYSLFNNRKIKNDIAITGEINLQKNVTAIGGLDLKILGGIKAGVKEFIFPKDNEKDFNKFLEKYKNKKSLKNIKFHMVETIHEVIDLVFI